MEGPPHLLPLPLDEVVLDLIEALVLKATQHWPSMAAKQTAVAHLDGKVMKTDLFNPIPTQAWLGSSVTSTSGTRGVIVLAESPTSRNLHHDVVSGLQGSYLSAPQTHSRDCKTPCDSIWPGGRTDCRILLRDRSSCQPTLEVTGAKTDLEGKQYQ